MIRRWAVLVLIVGLLLGAVAYDRFDHVVGTAAAPGPVQEVNPSVREPAPLSSVWYCPVGSAGGGYAEHTVEVGNVGADPAVATVAILTEEGPGPSIRVDLAAGERSDVALAELGTAAVAGAVVEVLSGQGVVSHVVASPHGPVRGACATSASDRWHFAGGVTTRDATYQLALLNPFPEDAVFDIRLQAEDRSRIPSELQGAIVPARSARVVDISAAVAREGAVAATVALRRGRVVAERLQTFNGVLGPVGSALELGTAGTGSIETWFPAGQVNAAGDHRLVLYNPNTTVAEIDVELAPQDPGVTATYGLVPIEVSVGAGGFEIVDLRALATQLGVPLPLELGLHVVAVNEVPIVAERWSLAPSLDPAAIGADVPPATADPAVTSPDAAAAPPTTAPAADGGGATTAPSSPDGTPDTTAVPTPDAAPATTAAPTPEAPPTTVPPTDGAAEQADTVATTTPATTDGAPGAAAPVAPTSPTPPTGVVIDRGVTTPARGWLLPATPQSAGPGTSLVVMGVDPDVTITVRESAAALGGPPIQTVQVAAGQRATLPVPSARALSDLIVTATGRVVVASVAHDADGSLRIANGIPVLEATP